MSITNLRKTEVEHFHISVVGQLNIGRLEIAVNNSLFVGRLERLCNGLRDFQ